MKDVEIHLDPIEEQILRLKAGLNGLSVDAQARELITQELERLKEIMRQAIEVHSPHKPRDH